MRKLLVVIVLLCCGSFVVVHAQDGNRTHIVRDGDTLTSIANRYGVSVDALIAANNLKDPNAIVVGQQLIIPGGSGSTGGQSPAPVQPSPGTYVVQRGDTLIGIAQKFGVSLEQLMAANKITDPAVIQIGQTLKIPDGSAGSSSVPAAAAPAQPLLADGQYTFQPSNGGPSIAAQVSGGRLASLTIQTISSGKQLLPLSCEAKIAGQIAMMYGLTFDEMSFLSRLPHSLNPRRGFVGSINGRFYWVRDLIGSTAEGPGGYGVHVEGWLPTLQALSGFQARLLSSNPTSARLQIDSALRKGYPVAIWAVLGFRENIAKNSMWIGADANGRAIDCGGPGSGCSYLVSGEHAYLIIGRNGDSYLVYDPGSGEIGYYARSVVINGITTLFAVPTGSAPGAVIIPSADKLPDLRQLPDW
ncbi:MAG: LysM peptidoglycan-binding domain-containing protein [Anaerolineae bacterium]|nr:LysM peptidoglycan-binding domain-containing protein [Anaerolineae bacterium]